LGLEGEVPDHSSFSKERRGRFRESDPLSKLVETIFRLKERAKSWFADNSDDYELSLVGSVLKPHLDCLSVPCDAF
jgi:hypothetical protein